MARMTLLMERKSMAKRMSAKKVDVMVKTMIQWKRTMAESEEKANQLCSVEAQIEKPCFHAGQSSRIIGEVWTACDH
jgi:hypothetical protein